MNQTHNNTKLNITLLCSAAEHPVMPYLRYWVTKHQAQHNINLIHQAAEAAGGDILFLISCSEIIKKPLRDKYKNVLVIHASDLPHGRGWSPYIWQILEGQNTITVSLLEAADGVDSGDIWHKIPFQLEGHELYNEINMELFETELKLMDFAVENFGHITPQKQDEHQATYYPRRTPADSELDPTKPLADQFDLLRIADPRRFPAFFKLRGHTYYLYIKKGQADMP